MADEENNSLTPEEAKDAAKAFSLLREMGSRVSLVLLAQRFGKEQARRLWALRGAGERPGGEPAFLSLADAEVVLRETERNPGHVREGIGLSVTLALLCGLRRSELARVNWHDVDARSGVVRIASTRGTSVRVVAAEESATAWLRWWKRWAKARCIGAGPKHLVVQEPDALRRWLAAAELPERVPRQPGPFLALLRGTYATMHLCAFRKPDALAANLGHVKAGNALVCHYEGLVTKGMAKAFWALLPRRMTTSEVEPLPPQVERRKAAVAEWRRERAERDRLLFREAVPHLAPAAVKRILEIVYKHPGRVETAAGMRIVLGLFAGFKAVETHMAQWEDIDLAHRTALKRPVLYGRNAALHARGSGRKPLPPKVVALHPTAVAWISLWRTWTAENGGAVTGPVVPKFTHFHAWRHAWIDPEKLLPPTVAGQDVFANTYFAMRYPDMQDSHPGEPVRNSGASEAEAFWALLPPGSGPLPPAVRRAVVRKPSGRPRRPAKAARDAIEPLPLAHVRTAFRKALERPGSVQGAPGVQLTLGFFVGLYTSEIEKARWSDIDWVSRILVVPEPEGHRDEAGPLRLELHPGAVRWLALWRDWAAAAGAGPDDRMVPQPWRFHMWRMAVRINARGKRWPHDAMRITYRARCRTAVYWHILPDRTPPPAVVLPGKSWRRKKKLGEPPYDTPAHAAPAPCIDSVPDAPAPGNPGLREDPGGTASGGGTDIGRSPEGGPLGLAQEEGRPAPPRPPDGAPDGGGSPRAEPKRAPGDDRPASGHAERGNDGE